MQIALGAYGMEGMLLIDDDMLRIDRRGWREEIHYSDIVAVEVHRFVKKVTIKTADRSWALTLWSGWPNKHRQVAAAIRERMAA